LFLELACIRWFPAHVLYLTFFTNVVLLASFLGMSVGCLTADRTQNYLTWTPLIILIALAAAQAVEISSDSLMRFVNVGNQVSPQQVYFGTEYSSQDLSRYAIPVEVLCGFFFIVIALAFLGPGQELGRALSRWPNRVQAYTLNIAGSILGITLFAVCSWLELSPFWWFLLVACGLSYFCFFSPQTRFPRGVVWRSLTVILFISIVWLSAFTPRFTELQQQRETKQLWSPYYRIDFDESDLSMSVNLIYHQQMVSRNENFPAYALPHLLNRDSGRAPFADVLIIGAGSGNDVSRALQWGAKHIDAVEIDPAIYRLGRTYHPDRPYQDERVHSGYSNIRLESFLFTIQTLADVRRHLKPDGVFVIYNYFRQGWLAARLQKSLEDAFGAGNPLVLTLPFRKVIEPEKATFGDFTIFFAGATAPLRDTFDRQPEYSLRVDQPPGPDSPNGFQVRHFDDEARTQPISDKTQAAQSSWQQFGLANVMPPNESLRIATDDWPFLYLRKPMIPTLSLRGMIIMGTLGLFLIYLFLPRRQKWGSEMSAMHSSQDRLRLYVQLFFLGAGFMLIETKAVVTMALLFGSTWIVNSVVFFAVLVMILFANYFTLRFKPSRIWPYYVGLFVTLFVSSVVPLDFFLGAPRSIQVIGSSLLGFAPILFAAVIFAGAMVGGLAEYSSMLVGFQYLVLVAILFYAMSAIGLFQIHRLRRLE
jgi:hypothetical protein